MAVFSFITAQPAKSRKPQIDKEVAPELGLHIICDNYSTHKHAKVTAWLKRHPRFTSIPFPPLPPGSIWWNAFLAKSPPKSSAREAFAASEPWSPTSSASSIITIGIPNGLPLDRGPNRILEKLDRAWEAMLEEIQSYLRDVTLAPGRKLLRLNQPWSLAGKCSLAVRLSAIHFTALSRAADNSLSSGTGIISISIKSPHM